MSGTTRMLAALVVSAALATGACEGRQDEAGEMSEEIEEIEESEDVDPSTDVDRPVDEIATLEGRKTLLEPRNDSGVSGTVVARRVDGSVKIDVSLDKTDPRERYVGHLHRGSCENVGAQVAPLEPFVHTPDGATESETRVEVSKLESDASYFVQIHGTKHAVIACGSLANSR